MCYYFSVERQGTTWHYLAALAVLASTGMGVFAGAADKNDALISQEIVKAWTDAGAEFHSNTFRAREKGDFGFEERALPAFRLLRWNEGVLQRLPDPGTAFGLDLSCMKTISMDDPGCGIMDGELKELAGLKSLRALSLRGTQVTGAGLKELAGLQSLQSLDLSESQVTDAGLKQLAGLKSLRALDLSHTAVKDAGMKELAVLNSLQELDLQSTRVTDAGLRELAGLESLHTSRLKLTDVTDAGLKQLARLNCLHSCS